MEIFNEINLENSYSENNSLKEKSYINSLNSTDISFSINNENSNRYSFKNLNELRLSYMNKLFNYNIPSNKNQNQIIKRKYNSIIFFDWDDTFLCSTFLLKNNEKKKISQEYFSQLENLIYDILYKSINYGDTYIITNSNKNWVIYTSMKFFPKIIQLFNKINIISARDAYEKQFPKNNNFWKLAVFIDIANLYKKNLVTNIISIGDSSIENEAAFKLNCLFNECYIKTIKFKDQPKPDELLKELKLVKKQMNYIHSAVRNISIKVEKKI
jgi:hypothetical protein